MNGPWPTGRVHAMDALQGLRGVPDGSVSVAVTSPPYWGQRASAGIGREADPRDYVAGVVAVLTEVVRCLEPKGTLWVNLGDSYNTDLGWRTDDWRYSTLGRQRTGHGPENSAYTKDRGRRKAYVERAVPWLQRGNLLGLPQRIMLALCDAGALLRGEVVWEKEHPMPEGLCRRPHRRHEVIWVLAKTEGHRFRRRPPVGSVWRLAQDATPVEHDAAFPLALPRTCLEAAQPPAGGTVCDPFMGSGTTAVAAVERGLDWLGFEVDPARAARAQARAEQAARQGTLWSGKRAGGEETRGNGVP